MYWCKYKSLLECFLLILKFLSQNLLKIQILFNFSKTTNDNVTWSINWNKFSIIRYFKFLSRSYYLMHYHRVSIINDRAEVTLVNKNSWLLLFRTNDKKWVFCKFFGLPFFIESYPTLFDSVYTQFDLSTLHIKSWKTTHTR